MFRKSALKSFLFLALVAALLGVGGPVRAEKAVYGPPAPASPASPARMQDSGDSGDGGAEGAVVVLELFTSDNCPFCPAAERNLSDIGGSDGSIIAMTCIVDYFDSGYTAKLSRPFCRDQQDVYVQKLKAGSRYTPQLVIDGAAQMPGQTLQKVSDAIHAAQRKNAVRYLEIGPGGAPGAYDVTLPDMPGPGPYTLRVTLVKSKVEPASFGGILKRDRSPYNIETGLSEGGIWDGKAKNWPIHPARDGEADGFIVTVQDQNTGHIVAAAQMRFPS